MFNSRNTLIVQFRLIRFGFILFTIHMMCVQIFYSIWCMDHVLFNSRTQNQSRLSRVAGSSFIDVA
jgi:hypothetical protein